jgi:MFS family permease
MLRELISHRLAPFRSEGFRKFFTAQVISLVGNWMQELAKTWIVLGMTGKGSAIGAVLFANAIPNLLLISVGGVWADRKSVRRILLVTQLLLSLTAFALGLLVTTGHVEYWHLVVFAAMEGLIIAFDLPAFNKVTPSLVPREHFQQALALNSVNFHLCRVLGPTLAGLVLGVAGPEAIFWINGFSFLGIVWVISRLNLPGVPVAGAVAQSQDGGMRDALNRVNANAHLRRVLIQLFVIICLIFPLVFTTFRVLVQSRFHLDGREFGFLFASPGVGSLLGSLTFLMWSPPNPLRIYPISSLLLIVLLIFVAEASTLPLMALALAAFSFALYFSLTALTVTLQLRIDNDIRGRISAIIGMAFVSIAPMMSAPVGMLSDWIGDRELIWVVAMTFAAVSLLFPMNERFAAIEALKKRVLDAEDSDSPRRGT